jgi:hypothetical protein
VTRVLCWWSMKVVPYPVAHMAYEGGVVSGVGRK